jgi:hypothetical protein
MIDVKGTDTRAGRGLNETKFDAQKDRILNGCMRAPGAR